MDLLLETVFLKYGYDFRDYARSSLKRRICLWLSDSEVKSFDLALAQISSCKDSFDQFRSYLTVSVSEMFRNPDVFNELRRHVIPVLRTYPFIRIWHAGCCTGQEVYSMAILLKEEGLLERARIYGTDISEQALSDAEKGIYPLDKMRLYTENYIKAGGQCAFSDYYTAKYGFAVFNKELRENVVFARHSLTTDAAFCEMNLIMCRNVLIYFNPTLKERAFKLFSESLHKGGFLCLGDKESIKYSESGAHFEEFAAKQRIYRRKYV